MHLFALERRVPAEPNVELVFVMALQGLHAESNVERVFVMELVFVTVQMCLPEDAHGSLAVAIQKKASSPTLLMCLLVAAPAAVATQKLLAQMAPM